MNFLMSWKSDIKFDNPDRSCTKNQSESGERERNNLTLIFFLFSRSDTHSFLRLHSKVRYFQSYGYHHKAETQIDPKDSAQSGFRFMVLIERRMSSTSGQEFDHLNGSHTTYSNAPHTNFAFMYFFQ
jgi:hypothetical protein